MKLSIAEYMELKRVGYTPDEIAAFNQDQPAPVVLDKPAPVVLDKPAPVVPDQPAPVVLDKPAPVVPDQQAPVVPETNETREMVKEILELFRRNAINTSTVPTEKPDPISAMAAIISPAAK